MVEDNSAAINWPAGLGGVGPKMQSSGLASNFAKQANLPRQVPPSHLCERADWTDFRTLETLCRLAGVPQKKLPAVVLKELVDNALDAGASCRFDELDDGTGFYVDDDGPGLGSPEEVGRLFSISRPRTSSKMLRVPSRGNLGNGLRVVSGAVVSTGGSLTVCTNGRRLAVKPLAEGGADVEELGPWDGKGTRVEVRLGRALDPKVDHMRWAHTATTLAGKGKEYKGRSSPWWYTGEAFHEVLRSFRSTPVEVVVARLEGLSDAKGVARNFMGRPAESLSSAEAARLLAAVRAASKKVNVTRLGRVGELAEYHGYGRAQDEFTLSSGAGGASADVPFVVEAWARPTEGKPSVIICVNRTPVTGEVKAWLSDEDKTKMTLYGCGLHADVKASRKRKFSILINVTCPAIGLTSNGKEPDLDQISGDIINAVEKAIRCANRKCPKSKASTTSRVGLVRTCLDDVVAELSEKGRRRFSLRNLFYAFRPLLIEEFGEEPSYKTFCNIITEIEFERKCDVPGMYRDTRGVIYHPHLKQFVPLGTLSVETYRRPAWTFNKFLFIEKEGLLRLLVEAGFPERYDCALITAKGQPDRASRDIIDYLAQTGEPLMGFTAQDADGYGTGVAQALQGATKARPERKIQVNNIGLSPAEARGMGIQIEPVVKKKKARVPVADHLSDEDREWLQKWRAELNAILPPSRFVEWVESKIAPYHEKVVPPADVMERRLKAAVANVAADELRERILREAGFDRLLEQEVERLATGVAERFEHLGVDVNEELYQTPDQLWTDAIDTIADEVVKKAAK